MCLNLVNLGSKFYVKFYVGLCKSLWINQSFDPLRISYRV